MDKIVDRLFGKSQNVLKIIFDYSRFDYSRSFSHQYFFSWEGFFPFGWVIPCCALFEKIECWNQREVFWNKKKKRKCQALYLIYMKMRPTTMKSKLIWSLLGWYFIKGGRFWIFNRKLVKDMVLILKRVHFSTYGHDRWRHLHIQSMKVPNFCRFNKNKDDFSDQFSVENIKTSASW